MCTWVHANYVGASLNNHVNRRVVCLRLRNEQIRLLYPGKAVRSRRWISVQKMAKSIKSAYYSVIHYKAYYSVTTRNYFITTEEIRGKVCRYESAGWKYGLSDES